MARILSLAFFLAAATLSAQSPPDLSLPANLAAALAQRSVTGLVVVDVRPVDEFRKGHIPGAINLSGDQLFSEFPSRSASAPLVVVGRPASADAAKAADIFRTRGYKNVVVFGSITRWTGALE